MISFKLNCVHSPQKGILYYVAMNLSVFHIVDLEGKMSFNIKWEMFLKSLGQYTFVWQRSITRKKLTIWQILTFYLLAIITYLYLTCIYKAPIDYLHACPTLHFNVFLIIGDQGRCMASLFFYQKCTTDQCNSTYRMVVHTTVSLPHICWT